MKEKNVIEFYLLCNKLKTLLRTGYVETKINAERLESVAEHIYSTQMLAIAMYSQYHYDIDLYKVVFMLAIHELEEIIIGDLTCDQIDAESKLEMGHKAILEVLKPLNMKDQLRDIIIEFDAHQSKESKFAYYCDKAECDLQCKLYCDTENRLEPANEWLSKDLVEIGYDDNFKEVVNYAFLNNLNNLR